LLRAFVAIIIPPEIKKAIASQTASLQKVTGHAVRWVPADNIHLTLKFLGDISPSSVELLSEALVAECSQHTPFELVVGGLGCFPNPRRPSVIWIGLDAPTCLGQLQHRIESTCAYLGYDPEEKSFSPHLTIGRVREQAGSTEIKHIQVALESKNIGTLGSFTVGDIHLFKSDLQPSGPIYTSLSSAGLGGGQPIK